MRIEHDADLKLFARIALPWLLRDPVANNLPCALIQDCLAGTVPTEPDTWGLRVVNDIGELAGVALCTPPGDLLLSVMPAAGAQTLAADLADKQARPYSVAGPAGVVEPFTTCYAQRTGVAPTEGTTQRLYRLDQLSTPRGAKGRLREASPADLDVLAHWLIDSAVEGTAARGPSGETLDLAVAEAAAVITARLRTGRLAWLWEDAGRPVSMAYLSPAIAGVTRVSGVYTPPQQRGNGYASACVAAVSRIALEHEASACVLYTNLANPTSNQLYQRIGYRPVCDLQEWRFR